MKLLIMPPSYRRNTSEKELPALQRYDGVLYRVLRKALREKTLEDLDILILTEDLRLVKAEEKIPFKPPIGQKWSGWGPAEIPDKVKEDNLEFLKKLSSTRKYDEIFIALGMKFRKAIEGIENIFPKTKIIYIQGRGLGEYAKMLKEWLEEMGG